MRTTPKGRSRQPVDRNHNRSQCWWLLMTWNTSLFTSSRFHQTFRGSSGKRTASQSDAKRVLCSSEAPWIFWRRNLQEKQVCGEVDHVTIWAGEMSLNLQCFAPVSFCCFFIFKDKRFEQIRLTSFHLCRVRLLTHRQLNTQQLSVADQ